MGRLLGVVAVSAVLLAGCGPVAAVAQAPAQHDVVADREAARGVLEAYLALLDAEDWMGAVALLDRRTMEFYERVRRDAVTLTASELKARPLREQVVVIMFRQSNKAASLRSQPIATLVAAGIKPLIHTRWLRLGEVQVDDDRATIDVSLADFDGRLPFELRRDPEGWRLNVVAATYFAADVIIDGSDADEVLDFLARHYGVDQEALYALPE